MSPTYLVFAWSAVESRPIRSGTFVAAGSGTGYDDFLGFWPSFRDARTLSDGCRSDQAPGSCLKTTGADLGVVDSAASWKRRRIPWRACLALSVRTGSGCTPGWEAAAARGGIEMFTGFDGSTGTKRLLVGCVGKTDGRG
jgi:hypothetical protein